MEISVPLGYEETGYSGVFNRDFDLLWSNNEEVLSIFVRSEEVRDKVFFAGIRCKEISLFFRLDSIEYYSVINRVNGMYVCSLYPKSGSLILKKSAYEECVQDIEFETSYLLAATSIVLDRLANDMDNIMLGVIKSFVQSAEKLYGIAVTLGNDFNYEKKYEYCDFNSKFYKTLDLVECVAERLNIELSVLIDCSKKDVFICYELFEWIILVSAKIALRATDRSKPVNISLEFIGSDKLAFSFSAVMKDAFYMELVKDELSMIDRVITILKGSFDISSLDGVIKIKSHIPVYADTNGEEKIENKVVLLNYCNKDIKHINPMLFCNSALPEIINESRKYEQFFDSLFLDD